MLSSDTWGGDRGLGTAVDWEVKILQGKPNPATCRGWPRVPVSLHSRHLKNQDTSTRLAGSSWPRELIGRFRISDWRSQMGPQCDPQVLSSHVHLQVSRADTP